jgi:hypothetical protein
LTATVRPRSLRLINGNMKAGSHKPIRRRSGRTFAGLPLFDIAYGPDPDRDEPHGKARGWLALGDSARGYIALGRNARGVIALGEKAMGLVALGRISIGLISLGGLALGAIAMGGLAAGGVAVGGCPRARWPLMAARAERESENNSV